MGVVLAVNVEAVEGRNISIMTVHIIDPRSDVLLCFTTFYLYSLTFVLLNCPSSVFIVEFE